MTNSPKTLIDEYKQKELALTKEKQVQILKPSEFYLWFSLTVIGWSVAMIFFVLWQLSIK